MQTKIKNLLIFLWLMCVFNSPHGFAQLSVAHPSEYSNIVNGTTYIVVDDPDSKANQPYIEVLEDYWTYTPLKVIGFDETLDYINENNTFINLSWTQVFGEYNQKFYSTEFFCHFWRPTKSYLRKSKRNNLQIERKYMDVLVYTSLFGEYESVENPEELSMNLDGDGKFKNWKLGFFKNYIQAFNHHLVNRIYQPIMRDQRDISKLNKLKTETLYIPEWVFTTYKTPKGQKPEIGNPQKLLKDFPYPYEIISDEELNKKILDNKSEFYYLLYVKSAGNKFVSIVNSQSGEIIYYTTDIGRFNFGPLDVKFLKAAIERKE